MPRRRMWSVRQRAALFDLPAGEAALLCHCTLSDDDIEHIRVRCRGSGDCNPWIGICGERHRLGVYMRENAPKCPVRLTAGMRDSRRGRYPPRAEPEALGHAAGHLGRPAERLYGAPEKPIFRNSRFRFKFRRFGVR